MWSTSARSSLLQRLGPSINANLSPVPRFEHVVLSGPCDASGLAEGRSVVVVHVPMSVRTPHLHKNGRVYQRVGDTSQPQPVDDRRLLDELWQRGERVREETRLWIGEDPEVSRAEAEMPYLRLMFVPDPWNKRYRLPPMSTKRFQRVLNQLGPELSSITFDSVFPSSDGFIARHVGSNDPGRLGLTLRVYSDCSCDVILPLNAFRGDAESLRESLGSSYELAGRYVDLLVEQGYFGDAYLTAIDVVDLNPVLHAVFAITAQYRALLGLVTSDKDYRYKVRAVRVWRKLPFLDVPHILDGFAVHGVPMLMDDEIMVPPGDSPDDFASAWSAGRDRPSANPERSAVQLQGIGVFFDILLALGVSGFTDEAGRTMEDAIEALVAAANRGATTNMTGPTRQ